MHWGLLKPPPVAVSQHKPIERDDTGGFQQNGSRLANGEAPVQIDMRSEKWPWCATTEHRDLHQGRTSMWRCLCTYGGVSVTALGDGKPHKPGFQQHRGQIPWSICNFGFATGSQEQRNKQNEVTWLHCAVSKTHKQQLKI